MDELFRFMVLRPPVEVDLDDPKYIKIEDYTSWSNAEEAEAFEEFETHIDVTGRAIAYSKEFDSRFSKEADLNFEKTEAIIEEVYGRPAAEIVALEDHATLRQYTADKLLALTFKNKEDDPVYEKLVYALRIYRLVERVAKQDPTLKAAGAIEDALNQYIVLPEKFVSYPEVVSGAFREIGVTELEIVSQELLRYEMGEIAHIENALKGESKVREHRRTRRKEEYILTETETTEETEQDLQSTDRFEMQREAQKTMKEESAFDFDLTLKYGKCVEVESSTKYANKHAREESSKTASNYAREVTDRTVSRVQERVLERRTQTIIEETEEKNTHTLSAVGKDEHTVGIYRWVDKVYNVQICNYGLRNMYEFIVPEPAAFLRHTEKNRKPEGVTMDEPKWPKSDPDDDNNTTRLQPENIGTGNYFKWVVKYGAKGVDAPPVEKITKSESFNSNGVFSELEDFWKLGFSADRESSIAPKFEAPKPKPIDIPDGYNIVKVRATYHVLPMHLYDESKLDIQYHPRPTFICISVGDKVIFERLSDPTYVTDSDFGDHLYEEWKGTVGIGSGGEWKQGIEELPVVVSAAHRTAWSVNVQVDLERAAASLTEWQNRTYQAIMTGYFDQVSKYQELLRQASVAEGIAIEGRNPLLNRDIEKTELKKACLMFLTKEHWTDLKREDTEDLVIEDTIKVNDDSSFKSFTFDFSNAADEKTGVSTIQFLEQAFEWDQIVYTFYPYFWSRNDLWADLVLEDDTDPLHARFLRAGAARVVVPVRPGYELSLRYYWARGIPWNGKGPPSVSDQAFLPIAQEMMEQLGIHLTKGAGTLSVNQGSEDVKGEGTQFTAKDVGREIVIEGFRYHIAEFKSETEVKLDKPYDQQDNAAATYKLGTKAVGEPWEIRLPTSLVILQKDSELPDLTKKS